MRFAERVVEVHEALAAAGIGHGFGGAIALAYAVEEPRATVDIDLNIAGDPDHPEDSLRSLPHGVRWDAADVAAIRADGQVRLWWDTTPVDLFFPQHAFHEVVASRYRLVPFAATTIPVLSATDLVVFKALFNRTKDWADIEAVIAAGTADVAEALGWLARLVGPESPQHQRLSELAAQPPPSADPDLSSVWKRRPDG